MTSPDVRARSSSRVAAVAAELWRSRRWVAVTAAAAIAVAGAMTHRVTLLPPGLEARGHTVGTASVLALIDTPRSQVADLGPSTRGAIAVLSARARLLATLMVTPPLRDRIARAEGLRPDELQALRPSTLIDRRRRVPAPRLSSIASDDPRAHVLHVAVNALVEGEHPIIAVDAQAPDAAAASALAAQAIASLKAHLDAEARAGAVPADRRVVVRQLQPPAAVTVHRGPSMPLALAAALIVFVAGCAAVVLVGRARARWPSPWAPGPGLRGVGRVR